MIRCEQSRSLLDMRLDGELTEELTRDLDRHLLTCRNCGFEARGLEQTRAMLRESIPSEASSPAFRERTAARLLDAFAATHRTRGVLENGRQWSLALNMDESK